MTGDRGLQRARRAQSHVVGVAILIGITTLSLGVLTAGIGAVVEGNAAAADADRVGDTFAAIDPAATTGVKRHRVAFSAGSLHVEERTLRVLADEEVVVRQRVDALVFTAKDRRITFLAGAVVRGVAGSARVTHPPPVASSERVLLVGIPVLGTRGTTAVAGGGTVGLRTDVTHERRALGEGRFSVAVETTTPGAWERLFAERGTTTTRRDFDGDGVPSVVAAYVGKRTAYVVVHDLDLEVGA